MYILYIYSLTMWFEKKTDIFRLKEMSEVLLVRIRAKYNSFNIRFINCIICVEENGKFLSIKPINYAWNANS